MKRKIYVASSWRNEYYPDVVEKLREPDMMCTTSATLRRVILDSSGTALARIIWNGHHSSIATCCNIRKLNDNSTTISRQWRLATLACWCYLAAEVHIRKLVGLQEEGN